MNSILCMHMYFLVIVFPANTLKVFPRHSAALTFSKRLLLEPRAQVSGVKPLSHTILLEGVLGEKMKPKTWRILAFADAISMTTSPIATDQPQS